MLNLKTAAFILFVTQFSLLGGAPDDSNALFLPNDPRGYIGSQAASQAHDSQLEQAKRSAESKPADADPDGHWGEISAGLQLSIRFTTNVFLPGQRIDVTVILRNTTTNLMIVPFVGNSSMELLVMDQNKRALRPTNSAIWLTRAGPGSTGLSARRQIRYPYQLSNIFDLSNPGTYSVSAKCAAFKGPWKDFPAIRSGIAEIRVVEPPRR